MKAIRAKLESDNETPVIVEGAEVEDWLAVCERFDDDVHRIRDLAGIEDYNSLYECFDDDNRSHLYLVAEDASLHRIRRKHFYRAVGKDS